MHKKKPEKKVSGLEPFFDSILVCNDKKIRPFIEILVQEPENITQHNLGTLLGVFCVEELSEDSSYIANYLISVIRKEYFSRPKRPAIESFEAALHKANLALSKLAEHENVKWIGKLNAIIAVVEKNNLHVTQAGSTVAFLLRSKSLTDISDGLASVEAEPHPLKTFVNVSSGRLEPGDKVIIATSEIFNIFSLEEIKKSALRFSSEKFAQFLRTALGNELEKAAVLVAEIREKKESPAPAVQKSENLNAFSQNAFQRQAAPENKEMPKSNEAPIENGENWEEKKNGHIYIKEGSYPEAENSPLSEYSVIFGEWFGDAGEKIARAGKNILAWIFSLKIPKINLPKSTLFSKQKTESSPATPASEASLPITTPAPAKEFLATFKNSFRPSLQKIYALLRPIFPDAAKLKSIAARLNRQQKFYASAIILAIIFVPLFALRLQKYIQSKNAPAPAPVAEVVVPLASDKSVVRLENPTTLYAADGILAVINLNGKIFAVSQTQTADAQNSETFAIPADFGTIKLAAGMDDLNLLFLINEKNQILAFSPASKKFQPNNLAVPENSRITAAGTYLTYLYLVDSAGNQIYRYPRAEGGFGAKNNWLKNSLDLSQASGVALSDNIFVTAGQNILKLFKGQKQDFSLETATTPIVPFKIYTQPDSQNIFVLDKQNARIIKLDLNGQIIAQYYNAEISSANSFTIDEKTNTAYLATSSEIKSFSIN
jgi:hypothetical protein